MTRIAWNKAGERFYEVGVDRGVLYPRYGAGVPWNGLVAVEESSAGGESEALYYDGVKYLDLIANEDFQARVEAFSAPREFAPAEGVKMLSPGLYVGQQPRQTFGFCYRTLKGNDLVGRDYGYKLHVVYNATAAPASRTNKTTSATGTPDTRTWDLNTVPPPASTFKPTAHLTVDSNVAVLARLTALETVLYGQDGQDPRMPSIAEIITILNG